MHADVLNFGWLGGFSWRRLSLPPAAWTGVGALAIPLWATWPALAVSAASIPAFEFLTIAFSVGLLMLRCLERHRDEGSTRPGRAGSGIVPVLSCALGLCGANAFFILATGYIPPAQANLISYLWPIMVVSFGGIIGLFRLRARHFLGLGLGFGGAAVVIGGSTVAASWTGIGLAFLSGCSWAAYCLFRMREGIAAANVLASACGLSAVICACAHIALVQTVMPALGPLLAAVAVGIAPLALANLAWDQGLRRGDGQLLAVMAYATPLASAMILIELCV